MTLITEQHLAFLQQAKEKFKSDIHLDSVFNDYGNLLAVRHGDYRDSIRIFESGKEVISSHQSIPPVETATMIRANREAFIMSIVEQLTKTKLNSTEYAIALLVLRFTVGIGRDEFEMPLSFIGTELDVNPDQAKRELRSLKKRMIVLVKPAVGRHPQILKINTKFEEWVRSTWKSRN